MVYLYRRAFPAYFADTVTVDLITPQPFPLRRIIKPSAPRVSLFAVIFFIAASPALSRIAAHLPLRQAICAHLVMMWDVHRPTLRAELLYHTFPSAFVRKNKAASFDTASYY